MPSRGLLLLAFCTVLSVLACWFAIDQHQRYQRVTLENQAGGLLFPAFQNQVGTIARLEVIRASGQFTLLPSEGGWINRGMGGYPVKAGQVEKVIATVARLSYIEPKTQNSNRYAKLQVEDVSTDSQSTRLTFKDDSGAVLADLIVGKPKNSRVGFEEQGTYIRIVGDSRAWLVNGALDVRYDAADWSDRLLLDIDADALMALTVKHANGDAVELHRQKPNDLKMTLKNLPVDAKVEHQFQIDYMTGLLQKVRLNDARRMKTAALATMPAFEVIAHTKDHLAITLRADEPAEDGSVWASIDAQVLSEADVSEQTRKHASRINLRCRGWQFKLPRTVTDRLKIRLSDIVQIEESIR